MKFVCSLTIPFLLFAFITNLSLAFSYDDGVPIIDTGFIAIHTYNRYFIVPSFIGIRNGRLKLEKTGDSKCPVTVLEDFTTERGTSVKFSIIGTSYDILTGTPIEIEFTKKPDCVESSKWLVFVDKDINKSCVGIGGAENYPGMEILNGTFNIQKYGRFVYKFVFCVNGSNTCSDIGWYNNGEGGGRLILADQKISAYVFFETSSYEDGIIKYVA